MLIGEIKMDMKQLGFFVYMDQQEKEEEQREKEEQELMEYYKYIEKQQENEKE